jgi:hypothetical protein
MLILSRSVGPPHVLGPTGTFRAPLTAALSDPIQPDEADFVILAFRAIGVAAGGPTILGTSLQPDQRKSLGPCPIAPLYSDNGRPAIASRFVIGLLLLRHIYGLSDDGVCERWVYDPYLQDFTSEVFSSMRSRTNFPTSAIGAGGWATSWSSYWPRACGWRMRPEPRGRAISNR